MRAGKFPIVIVLSTLILTAVGGLPLLARAGDTVAYSLRRNVVRIQALLGPGKEENGFGFIAGERSGLLYIVTAYHVVVDRDAVGNTPSKVKVEFFERRGQLVDATLLGTHDADHDLAVLTAAKPAGFDWTRSSLAGPEKQKRGVDVWFVGKDRDWNPPVVPGHVAKEVSTDWLVEVEGLNVKRGSSGGPVISDTGIVGMIQSDSEDGSQFLSIDFIKKTMERWSHPWQLTLTAAAPPVIPLQVEIDAINQVIEQYRTAYNNRNASALWSVWPDPKPTTKKNIETSFKNSSSINYRLQLGSPQISSDRSKATVTGQSTLEQRVNGNQSPLTRQADITITLQKKGGSWKVSDVN